MIILLDISTINSTDFFDKILRGQMGEGGRGGRVKGIWRIGKWCYPQSVVCVVVLYVVYDLMRTM